MLEQYSRANTSERSIDRLELISLCLTWVWTLRSHFSGKQFFSEIFGDFEVEIKLENRSDYETHKKREK